MSAEKKFKTETPVLAYTTETMPEWALGNEGMENFLDGIRIQLSVNENRHKGEPTARIAPLDPKSFEGMSDETKTLEVLCGTLVAYFSAMAKVMPQDLFARTVGPLTDVIANALHSVNIIEPLSEEETDQITKNIEDQYKSIDAEKLEKMKDKQLGQKIAEFEKDTELSKAMEKLKSIGRGLIH